MKELICANLSHPKFQDIKKNVPAAFISQMITINENMPIEEIYSKYIYKLQQTQPISQTLPTVLQLKNNEWLYEKYKLLSDKKVPKILKKSEGISWIKTLNQSPYYSFTLRKTPSGWSIFILPKQDGNFLKTELARLSGSPLSSQIGENVNRLNEYFQTDKSDSQTILRKIARLEGGLGTLAKQLLKSNLNVPIELLDVDYITDENSPEGVEKMRVEGLLSAAIYDPATRKIYVAKNTKFKDSTEGTLLHEILHAYTYGYILNNPNAAAVKAMQKLNDYLNTDKMQQLFSDKYPLNNIDEMLTAVFTNPYFIEDLKKIPATNKNFKSVWDELLQIFKVIFGIQDKTLFDEIFAYSSQIVEESMQQMEEFEIADEIGYIKPGIKELFDSNPELSNIGTQEQYSQYLDTIFPDSKVKDIVYHRSPNKFDLFDDNKIGSNTIKVQNDIYSEDRILGHFFSKIPYSQEDTENVLGSNLYSVIVNIINPSYDLYKNTYAPFRKEDDFGFNISLEEPSLEDFKKSKNNAIKNGKDGIIEQWVIPFTSNQIHILGSKQDIKGFKEFVGKSKPLASSSNIQQIISNKLDKLSAKVQNIDQNYVVEGFDISWIRPSQLAKLSIQKRSSGVKTEAQEEFEKLAQEAGTILHGIQANIIKEAFPEYNKHITKMVVDEDLKGFEEALRLQLQPLIQQAKDRGSVMKAEIWVGNTKTQKGGTIDLLEIDKDGNYYVYDLKTRFTEDVSPLRRATKLNEWTEQTSHYNEILKSGDADLGVVKGNVLGTYILELNVELKPENKITYSASTKYKAVSAERFLIKRQLSDIKMVAPKFLRTGHRKIDEMIGRLLGQIDNMTKSPYKGGDREAFNRTLESKLDLLQSLQLKKDISLFIDNGYLELAIIKKQLEEGKVTDSRFVKEQLELYSNALKYLTPIPDEMKDSVKRLQSEAQDLQLMFEDLGKDMIMSAAKETEVTKNSKFGDNIFAAVKDIGWVFSQSMGVANIDNPIVQTLFRKTTTALSKAREKVQELADMMIEKKDAYVKATGDTNYNNIIEDGHLVDEWQTAFWKEYYNAKQRKDFEWAKDNVTFDKKAYLEARDKQLDYHDTITRDVYYNKIKLQNPELKDNEIKKLVEEEIAAQMKKWDATHNNAFTYFTPKSKWVNPKYEAIIKGPKEGIELYNFFKNLIGYANEILPEKVKRNFIPNYQADYIERSSKLGLLGAVKSSWSGFNEDIELTYDDELMSKKDAITGEKLGTMWIPGITEVKDKSLDLPVVFLKFMDGVYRYEELKTLEELAITTKEIIKGQQFLAVDAFGNAVSTDITPARPNPASRTLALMEGWIDEIYYNKRLQKDYGVEIKGNGFTELFGLKKGDSKKLSVGKMVDKVIKWTTLKNLGFSLYSPIVNVIGGTANMYMTGANGAYYDKKDLTKAMNLALSGKVNLPNEDAQKAKLILEWLNIDTGEFIKKTEEGLTNSITKKIISDYNALSLMRESESVLRNAGALAVVLGGKYQFNWDSFKVEDGKLVVEANDFQKEKFRQQIIQINRKNIGGIGSDDIMLAKQYIVGRMFMQHRSWLPALFFERFGTKRYDWVLEKDIEGRYVTLVRTFRHLFAKSKYKELEPFEKENLKSVGVELAMLLSTGILLHLLKSGLDDDDKKEAWYKITEKVSGRVYSELLFFVDPTFQSQYDILLSPAASLGTAADVGKLIGSFFKEQEDKRTKTPLQRAVKLTPLSKVESLLIDLGISPLEEK